MIAKKVLVRNLFYTIALSLVYGTLFFIMTTFKNISFIFVAILCAILNLYILNKTLVKTSRQFEVTVQNQRETYISTINHNLKIPTLAQIQALRLLYNEQTGKINKRQKEIIGLTLESCSYMYDMLSTILSTYKYENNDISLFYEKIHLVKLIDDCFKKSIKSLQNKNLKVRIKSKEEFFIISGDKTEIKKAFENIINYSIACAYENTQIICEIKKEEDNISLIIGFKSPYVSSDSMQNMFNKYSTSETFDKVGSGLEIYLAKQIIDAHKGKIFAERKKSDYNTYNIKLPCINDCKVPASIC